MCETYVELDEYMASTTKKKSLVSYEKMSPEVAAAFTAKYPRGFNDYLSDIVTYPKPDGTKFYAVQLEMEDAVYLVKVKVKTDDVEDVNRWLNEVPETGNDEAGGESSEEGSNTLPDDNISQYSTGDDES